MGKGDTGWLWRNGILERVVQPEVTKSEKDTTDEQKSQQPVVKGNNSTLVCRGSVKDGEFDEQ